MEKNRFPPGWDDERVKRVLSHYENQSDEDAAAEDDAVFEGTSTTVMEIPKHLVADVRELIARKVA